MTFWAIFLWIILYNLWQLLLILLETLVMYIPSVIKESNLAPLWTSYWHINFCSFMAFHNFENILFLIRIANWIIPDVKSCWALYRSFRILVWIYITKLSQYYGLVIEESKAYFFVSKYIFQKNYWNMDFF